MENTEIKNFFHGTSVNIFNNDNLRIPQQEAYSAIIDHFSNSTDACYAQLPVGCGKTGLIGLCPFGLTDGRVLVVTPNLTIRANMIRELDISDPNCFYVKRGVLTHPFRGPFISELKPGANIHDCDEAHIVVSNIQQFSGKTNRWYEQLPRDYFTMILIDEGHHNVASSWQYLCDYFNEAKVISFTATPVRSDGQMVMGEKVYSFGYARSMMMGYISTIESVMVTPTTLSFTAEGKSQNLTLDQVLEMKERDWFSRGIALSEECNRHIVEASIRQWYEVKTHGTPRQIIACACSIRHAVQVSQLYHEYGLRAEVLHSNLDDDEKTRIETALRNGLIDVVVQVQMLGEGYDLGTLSIAAVFRPYRSLSPYIQFLGRILRLADPTMPFSPSNKVYVVSHIGLNDDRWWEDFTNFDKDDQKYFQEYLEGRVTGINEEIVEEEKSSPRLTLRPFMQVLNETIEKYVTKGFLTEVNESLAKVVLDTLRASGFDPIEFGLTEEMMRRRLQMATSQDEIIYVALPVQPQRRKESLRKRVAQEGRSIANTVLNRLGLHHVGKDLLGVYPGYGVHNLSVVVTLAQNALNDVMGLQSGERDNASIEQLEKGLEKSPEIVDKLTAFIKNNFLKNNNYGSL